MRPRDPQEQHDSQGAGGEDEGDGHGRYEAACPAMASRADVDRLSGGSSSGVNFSGPGTIGGS